MTNLSHVVKDLASSYVVRNQARRSEWEVAVPKGQYEPWALPWTSSNEHSDAGGIELLKADLQSLGVSPSDQPEELDLADLLNAAGRFDEAMEHLHNSAAIYGEISGDLGKLEPEIWMLTEW